MKITQRILGEDDRVLTEDAREIVIDVGNSKFILIHADRSLTLLTPKGGIVQDSDGFLVPSGHPVRRTYFEPFAQGGMIIFQKVFDDDE